MEPVTPHTCRLCGYERPSSLNDLRLIDGHRLYLVATGTTWRFWRAKTAKQAEAQVRQRFGHRGKARIQVCRATKDHLLAVLETAS